MKTPITLLALVICARALADPFTATVTTPSFTGSGSLSEAIAQAEAAVTAGAESAVIDFAFNEPTEIEFANELFVSMEFDEQNTLTIDGGGQVTLSGANSTRLFFVDGQRGLFPDPDGPSGHLILRNLTVREGFSDDTGGAIWTDGSVTLSDTLFVDNSVIVPDDPFACLFDRECDGGGAVFVGDFGILVIENSEFRNNQSLNGIGDYGGAITNAGAMAAINTLFATNTAGDGGGAMANGGLAVIYDSRFVGNHADGFIGGFEGGGAIVNGGVGASLSEFQRLIIVNTEFEANFTTGSAVDGGAIFSNGEMVIAQSLFVDNYVDGLISDGGAITNTSAPLTIFNTTFSGNRVIGGGEGGAIAASIGPVTIVHATFTDNSISDADTLGGSAIAASPDAPDAVAVINSTIHSNRVANIDGNDLYGAFTLNHSVVNDVSNATLVSAADVRFGNGAGAITTLQGHFPVAQLVDSLADNGGQTRTHAIDTVSVGTVSNPLLDTADAQAAASAIAAISPDSAFYLELGGVDLISLTDQRGLPATALPRNDIGAFERINADGDGDGIADDLDNCLEIANPLQTDADNDGFGNFCDPDLNNDNIVNFIDLGILRLRFFSADAVADFNADGVVNFVDLGILRSYFFLPPGP